LIVVQFQYLVCGERYDRITSSDVIAELDFVHSGREAFDNGTYLTALQSIRRPILKQRNNRKHLDFSHFSPQSNFT
jgi:hypothetical protein